MHFHVGSGIHFEKNAPLFGVGNFDSFFEYDVDTQDGGIEYLDNLVEQLDVFPGQRLSIDSLHHTTGRQSNPIKQIHPFTSIRNGTQ